MSATEGTELNALRLRPHNHAAEISASAFMHIFVLSLRRSLKQKYFLRFYFYFLLTFDYFLVILCFVKRFFFGFNLKMQRFILRNFHQLSKKHVHACLSQSTYPQLPSILTCPLILLFISFSFALHTVITKVLFFSKLKRLISKTDGKIFPKCYYFQK